MENTYERFTTGGGFSPDTETEHLERYRYACPFVKGQDVVDIACGSGYGSKMLADAGARSVRGFDVSAGAVEFAGQTYRQPNLTFGVGDATDLRQVESGSVDCVVSFETIEHLQDDGRYLDEMRRILKPGGRFLVSTPDRRLASTMYPIRRRPNNEFHVREYTRGELLALLKSRFNVESLAGQSFVGPVLTFWPLQVALKASCYGLRKFGAYKFIRRIYHVATGFHVQPCADENPSGIARYWVVNCRRPA
jgi:SAM-dependent methyltransferase